MKSKIILFLFAAILMSCSSDDNAPDTVTSMKLTLRSASLTPASNISVYAYDQTTWQVIGNNPLFADYETASGSDGVATFSNLYSELTFNELSNFTQTFRFSASYSINGTNRTKVLAVTFNQGDKKTEVLILD